MFVSLKCNKRLVILMLAAVAALAVLCLLDLWLASPAPAEDAAAPRQTAAADDIERADFLAQFGWTVSPTPAEVQEITVPEVFDEIYETYNDLQRSQGFDLTPYRGKRVKRWSYDVTNYPDGIRGVRANLLVWQDRVIGGDLCGLENEGFLHGFRPVGVGLSGLGSLPA